MKIKRRRGKPSWVEIKQLLGVLIASWELEGARWRGHGAMPAQESKALAYAVNLACAEGTIARKWLSAHIRARKR